MIELSMGRDAKIEIRPWASRDRHGVEALLRLLSADAAVQVEDAPTYVAHDGEQVIGMVTLCVFRTLTGPKAYLDHLVVAPEWRRRGIGRALVDYVVQEAKKAGASRIDLTAGDAKPAGRALYAALGFRERRTSTFRLSL